MSIKDNQFSEMTTLSLILAVWIFQMAGSSDPNERNFGHERVLENILKNYRDAQFLVRPAQNTTAEISLSLIYIKSFNKNTGRLVAGYYLRQRWVDSRLKWEDLSVSSINLPPDRIWKPDWRLWNSLDHVEKVDATVLPLITNDGTVTWVTPAEYTTTCRRGESGDGWDCVIKIGSWTHTAYQVSHAFFDNSSLIDVTSYTPELFGYDVEPQPGAIETKLFNCCSEPYQDARFNFRLRVIEGGVASGVCSLLHSSIAALLSCVVFTAWNHS